MGSKPLNARSDVLLLMFVTEEERTEHESTVVWSNWIYRVRVDHRGEIVKEVYQAVGHERREFTGMKVGGHAVLQVATDNKNMKPIERGTAPINGLRVAMAPVSWSDEGPRERKGAAW